MEVRPRPPKPPPSDAPGPNYAELQSQIDIAITHIKNLNSKVMEMDQHMELIERHHQVQLEPSQLKEMPMDPADFTQKLLKLAEHVIVLEKEVARLKGNSQNAPATAPKAPPPAPPQSKSGGSPKPPIMPI